MAAAGATVADATLCMSVGTNGQPTLDPALVAGKIVMCTRGGNDRVDKSLAVKNAGGIGMVLIDPSPNSQTADFHSVPSIHLNNVSGAAVKAYIASAGTGATAAISAVDTTPVEAPSMGSFSSFGPALAGGGNLLKPDITAPGVSVIAAVAPPGNGGLDYNSYDGTSMSTPHITGIAALILQKHPSWSPMWVKSALMTGGSSGHEPGQPDQARHGPGHPARLRLRPRPGQVVLRPGPGLRQRPDRLGPVRLRDQPVPAGVLRFGVRLVRIDRPE